MVQQLTISLDKSAYKLYCAVAQTSGLTVEQVIADALFTLAGELSLKSLGDERVEEIKERFSISN